MNKTVILGTLVLAIATVVLLLLSPQVSKSLKSKDEEIKPVPLGYYRKNGIIRTTGLSSIEGEKAKLGLKLSDYQLTDLKPPTYSYQGKDFYGYFIEDSDFDYPTLVGTCVDAEIQVTTESTESTQAYSTYGRIGAKVLSLSSVPREKCTVYPKLNAQDQQDHKIETLIGTLEKTTRPSPEISYDYSIVLNETVQDTENASGLTQEVTSYIIVPASDAIWGAIEDNLSQKVELKGYFEQGYAEGKYFRVTNVIVNLN